MATRERGIETGAATGPTGGARTLPLASPARGPWDRVAGRRGLDQRATFWPLVVPPSVWLLVFFVVPLLLVALISLRPDIRDGVLSAFSPTLAQYQTLLDKPNYLRLLGISAAMALAVAAGATLLAYPVAYFLAYRAGRWAGLCLLLLLIPFWTSFLLRVMAWKVMLGSNGVVNNFLGYLGLIGAPLDFLLYNRFAVVVTLVYVWTPFVALPILAGLHRIDPALFEAAADLGASRLRRFWRVTLPLSLPGVLAGFFICFIPTVGEYVTPLLVGGSGGSMYGNLVQDFFTKAGNWPLGGAMALVMLAGTLIVVALAVRLIDLRRLAA